MKFQLSLYLILQSLEFHLKKSGNFVVTKENMLFCMIGYKEHNTEAIEIQFEWK